VTNPKEGNQGPRGPGAGNQRGRVADHVRELRDRLNDSATDLLRQSAEDLGRAGSQGLAAGVLGIIEPTLDTIEEVGAIAGVALEQYIQRIREKRPDLGYQDVIDDLVDRGVIDADDLGGPKR